MMMIMLQLLLWFVIPAVMKIHVSVFAVIQGLILRNIIIRMILYWFLVQFATKGLSNIFEDYQTRIEMFSWRGWNTGNKVYFLWEWGTWTERQYSSNISTVLLFWHKYNKVISSYTIFWYFIPTYFTRLCKSVDYFKDVYLENTNNKSYAVINPFYSSSAARHSFLPVQICFLILFLI